MPGGQCHAKEGNSQDDLPRNSMDAQQKARFAGPFVVYRVNTLEVFMVYKREASRDEQTYELVFDHLDLVTMMNDSTVALGGGIVSDEQRFRIYIRKENDQEICLSSREIRPGDKVVFRFNVVELAGEDTPFISVEVS